MVLCEECHCVSDDADAGWITFIQDDEDDPDRVWRFASYCPSCAFREFGVIPRVAYT